MAINGFFPAPLEYNITTANDGATFVYGNTSTENPFGSWTFQFVPSLTFQGTFGVTARAARIPTTDTTIPWLAVPYRRISLNNTAQDYSLVTAQLVGTNDMIVVPANGLAVGIQMTINAGSCLIRARWSILNSL
jgi:hypothetical protein